ncbi:MAG: hypothetical protein R3E39_25660 [Anaerolineae bacterium]
MGEEMIGDREVLVKQVAQSVRQTALVGDRRIKRSCQLTQMQYRCAGARQGAAIRVIEAQQVRQQIGIRQIRFRAAGTAMSNHRLGGHIDRPVLSQHPIDQQTIGALDIEPNVFCPVLLNQLLELFETRVGLLNLHLLYDTARLIEQAQIVFLRRPVHTQKVHDTPSFTHDTGCCHIATTICRLGRSRRDRFTMA